jgi:hypothetical protein
MPPPPASAAACAAPTCVVSFPPAVPLPPRCPLVRMDRGARGAPCGTPMQLQRSAAEQCAVAESVTGAQQVQQLRVDVAQAAAWQLPVNWSSVGIEYLNHEIYGGLYSQLVFGESFEEPASAAAGASTIPPPPPPHTPTVHGLIVRRGYLTAGMDLRVAEVNLTQAIAFCVNTSTCCGFTFPVQGEAT